MQQRAEDGHGNGEQDDEGQREALILGGEGEIDDEKAETEDDDGLAGRLDFFEREAGPGVGHAVQHVFLGEVLHAVRPCGAEPGAGEPSISAERKRL